MKLHINRKLAMNPFCITPPDQSYDVIKHLVMNKNLMRYK